MFICAHKGHNNSMPSYHLHASNDTEEIYTGKHVELNAAQGASTETAYFITEQENYLLSY